MVNNKALKEAVQSFIEQLGYIPLDLQVRWSQEEWKIHSAIFRETPITLRDCANVTRSLQDFLRSWLGNEDFSLDISSPGAERILKSVLEYTLFRGKRVKVVFKSGQEDFFILMGLDETDDSVRLFNEEKQAESRILIQDIAKCQLVL